MCGIVAAIPAYDERVEAVDGSLLTDALPGLVPDAADLLGAPREALDELSVLEERLAAAVALFSQTGAALAMTTDPRLARTLSTQVNGLQEWASSLDKRLDALGSGADADTTEGVQSRLRRIRDRLWELGHDRIEAAARARALSPRPFTGRSATSYLALSAVLDGIDRLEVRGRDSAGVSVWVDLDSADRASLPLGFGAGRADPLLRDGAMVTNRDGVCFVYKHAAIVGRLGDNVAALRRTITDDEELHRVLALPSATVTIIAHTRWASVGRISEANAHPVDSRRDNTAGGTGPFAVPTQPAAGEGAGRYALAVLNGDIDNYLDLREQLGYHPESAGVTTDAKLIPILLAAGLAAGEAPDEAMRAALARFEGSMAIAARGEDPADEIVLAVKGSGQALYVGFTPGGYLVASEAYGLVANTRHYLRVEGRQWPGAERAGTIVRLSRSGRGGLASPRRIDGDGRERPVEPSEIREAEVTTRDLALGDFEHYLQKEINESSASFGKTLRGRVHVVDDQPRVSLPASSVPPELRHRLASGAIREIVLVGQGTAGVACTGIAVTMRTLLPREISVLGTPATEFSAWGLRRDMSDVCVIAVSQSGSTTDTNRAVDLARERGATVLAIVNRRDSDLAEKSHGVLYTSDGRDVELSVASTKAFYAQVAAGCLLALEIGREIGSVSADQEAALLRPLLRIPDQLIALRAVDDQIAAAAGAVASRYPYWAVVGSGPNRVAAAEIRIKLSELCYKTISDDAVEDKKHIDLSAEALVLVCAAGAQPRQVADLVKEVDILAAHRNRPVVICDDATAHLWPADLVIPVPATHPAVAWILSTAAGHLFAYHAARTIDATADDVRLALASLEAAVDRTPSAGARVPAEVYVLTNRIMNAALDGQTRGVLTSRTAMALAVAAATTNPVEGAVTGSGRAALNDPVGALRAALTAALDELGRPIDTVKHQAKTVTVGTSRSDADLYDNQLVQALRDAGADAAALTYPTLHVLRSYDGVVARATGVARYRITTGRGGLYARITTKTGAVADLPSRADQGAPLTGSKRRVHDLRVPRLVRGRLDERIVLIVPEHDGTDITNLSVVHVELRQPDSLGELKVAMDATGERMAEIVEAVTETQAAFDANDLLTLPIADVLLEPTHRVAELIASRSPAAPGQTAQAGPSSSTPSTSAPSTSAPSTSAPSTAGD